ncbi:MAG TPA: hypothetical protein VIN08_11980 [Ohtaekwangia sp.]|uniref:hypothetical protein n=1 Tax=Ohtaekwangia sp. TaxID=2066019 RepID=UPI002F91C8F9
MDSSHFLIVKDPAAVSSLEIPVLYYNQFYIVASELLQEKSNHCIKYTATIHSYDDGLTCICYIADDQTGEIKILSYDLPPQNKKQLLSLSRQFSSMYTFERDLAHDFGIDFIYLPSNSVTN